MVQNYANPQTLNRYSYCVNNPLKYTDPSGHDVLIMLGKGTTSYTQEGYDMWHNWAIDTGLMTADENFEILADFNESGIADVGPRLAQLECRLLEGDLTNIKLVGFSEGAATIGTLLANVADNPNYMTNVRDELKLAMLLECPTGPLTERGIHNYDWTRLNNLPDRLTAAGAKRQLGDAWNSASMVHRTKLDGWNSYSYDSRPWYVRAFDHIPIQQTYITSQAMRVYLTFKGVHSNIINSKRLTVAYNDLFSE